MQNSQQIVGDFGILYNENTRTPTDTISGGC